MTRVSVQSRKTRETEITVKIDIDGKGKANIHTGIKFLDHMLELLTFFAIFDLELNARGDLEVDIHHTNEDIGIILGKAFKIALAGGEGIRRFGYSYVPMEECLVRTCLDICGRSRYERTNKGILLPEEKDQSYGLADSDHFLESFSKHSGINLDVAIIKTSQDMHHLLEAIFKSMGLSLKMAASIDPRRQGITSTKGIIDL